MMSHEYFLKNSVPFGIFFSTTAKSNTWMNTYLWRECDHITICLIRFNFSWFYISKRDRIKEKKISEQFINNYQVEE